MRGSTLLAGLFGVSIVAAWPSAWAQDDHGPRAPLVLRPLPEQADAPNTPARIFADERPFLYALDPTTPSAGTATAEYAVGIASGVSPERPLPIGLGTNGASHAFTAAFGATDTIAPFATGRLLTTETDDQQRTLGAGSVGLRWQLTSPRSPFKLTLAGAGLREFGGALGGSLRVAASYDIDRVRLVGNVHGEHVFATRRDGIDIVAIAGVSYRTLEMLRLGVEYVGQDLEGAVEKNEAEGGVKHFAGPTMALDLDRGRVQLVAGPAFGLNQQSPRVLGRAAVLVAF